MSSQNIIVLMGPPGSGKGTQSKLLIEKFGYAYFSMGDALREYGKMDNELGQLIRSTIDKGSAVTDEIVNKIFFDSMEKIDFSRGLIIDGMPRSLGQLEALNRFLAKHNLTNSKLLILDVNEQKLIERLQLRGKEQGRADDSDIAFIKKRFEEYRNKTSVAKDYYESRNEAIHVNGDQSIEEVHQEILSKLQ